MAKYRSINFVRVSLPEICCRNFGLYKHVPLIIEMRIDWHGVSLTSTSTVGDTHSPAQRSASTQHQFEERGGYL